ncbi:MAG: hypothetical protein AAF911_15075 [Planctomycetota bacterium]
MSMVPPAWPDDNLNPDPPPATPSPGRRTPHTPRPVGFTGPKPRLAGEGQFPETEPGHAGRSHADGQPRLRLVGAGAIVKPDLTPTEGTAIAGTNDPRWVLAVRVAEQLQGTVLPPAKRDRLIKIGKMFGLTAFDANLIIAIVQDQARRGYAPAYCPTAGEPQLRMVPPPQKVKWMTPQRTFLIAGIIAGFIALELVVLSWVF